MVGKELGGGQTEVKVSSLRLAVLSTAVPFLTVERKGTLRIYKETVR